MNGGHLKLGIFVTTAVGLLVAMLLLLGVLQRFTPTVMVETYFAEPIQGLQSGAAVRFRGMQIGSVRQVGFAAAEYGRQTADDERKNYNSLIMVQMAIEQSVLKVADFDTTTMLDNAIKSGLRARLASSGLGGPTYVELDYMDADLNLPPELGWTPKHLFIPSAPSTIREIITQLETLLVDANRTKLIENLSALAGLGPDLQKLTKLVEDSDLMSTATSALKELQSASTAAEELLGGDKLNGLLTDASTTLDDVRGVIKDGRPVLQEMEVMATSLTGAANALDGVVRTVEDAGLIPQLESLAKELGPAGKDLGELAQRLNQLIGENTSQISDTIASLRVAALELQALLEEIKANPGRLLSDPPPRRTPGAQP